MKNIPTEDPKHHWSFLDVKDKLIMDMGCSFYEAYYNPGMLSSAEWFIENGAAQVIGFDGDPDEVKKYNIVYKNDPRYEIFELWLDSPDHIRKLLEFKPQVIKCDIEGAEINFLPITKKEMECVEEIAFEYHDVPTREMCEIKLKEWGFDFIEQYSILDRNPEEQGVYHGLRTNGKKTKVISLLSETKKDKSKVSKKAKVPKVLYVGKDEPHLESIHNKAFEDCSLDIKYITNDENINEVIASFKPDSIVTVGENDFKFPNLYNNVYDVRKRWVNVSEVNELTGHNAYYCAMHQMLTNDNSKMISYFTPSYNTGVKLYDTYMSLVAQTYKDWEWVIVDDSNDGGKTLQIARNIASTDPRVKVYNFDEKSGGVIGEAKYRAASLCRGYLLAELDHDDLLTDNCTMDLYNASQAFPDAGFFYNDSVEVNQWFQCLTYGEGFAMGYGKYEKVQYKNYIWDVAIAPNINPKTIRHIVGVPNHVRAWRRETYFAVGGHNRELSIADDYELIIRTFLHTKMVKIPKLGYIQFLHFKGDEQNSHDIARADIQRRVRTIMEHYNEQIAKRFEELGVKDWVFESKNLYPWEVSSRYGDEEGYVNEIFLG
jgi:glycosyltransferase involved in cell wall biosynthesis